jgi:A/G-specific adenine glycosylase
MADRTMHAFVFLQRGRLLLRRRPEGGVNGGLWEFPNSQGKTWKKAAQRIGLPVAGVEPLRDVRHTITHHRIHLHSWFAGLAPDGTVTHATKWVSLGHAVSLPFPAAHRKILLHLLVTIRASGPRSKPASLARSDSRQKPTAALARES